MRNFPIIHIVGLPGAGKTTLALKLSKKLNLPVFRIGCYRAKYSSTPIGEADTWVALYKDLSKRKWGNCILETTGLNFREEFLRKVLPFDRIFTIKLEASKKTLMERIKKKKKKEQGGKWPFCGQYRDKDEFVKKLFKNFKNIPANYKINTNRLTAREVYNEVVEEIGKDKVIWEYR
ncbi:MAG: AAA family ATPase [Candidatus Omnitrophota bacterium]